MSSVWVGHPKDPYPLGPNAQGGAIAAPIWGAYMKSAKGKFCGDFPKPKVPFTRSRSSASTRRRARRRRQETTRRARTPGAQQPGQGIKPQDNGQGTKDKNGGGSKYPPDAYASPPQGTPNTQQPPASTTPGQATPGTGTNGGTGAPSPG